LSLAACSACAHRKRKEEQKRSPKNDLANVTQNNIIHFIAISLSLSIYNLLLLVALRAFCTQKKIPIAIASLNKIYIPFAILIVNIDFYQRKKKV
jgi:hypothetical protein